MAKYEVVFSMKGYACIVVEAENKEAARKAAWETVCTENIVETEFDDIVEVEVCDDDAN